MSEKYDDRLVNLTKDTVELSKFVNKLSDRIEALEKKIETCQCQTKHGPVPEKSSTFTAQELTDKEAFIKAMCEFRYNKKDVDK